MEEQLRAAHDRLCEIAATIDATWAIGGTGALALYAGRLDPALAQPTNGVNLLVDDLGALRRATAHIDATEEVARHDRTGFLADPLVVAFRLGDGAIAVGYGIHPDPLASRAMREAALLAGSEAVSAARSLVFSAALGRRVSLPRLTAPASGTVALDPGGVALAALASAVTSDSAQSRYAREFFGPALIAARVDPHGVERALSNTLALITNPVPRRGTGPRTVVAEAGKKLLEMARSSPIDDVTRGALERGLGSLGIAGRGPTRPDPFDR